MKENILIVSFLDDCFEAAGFRADFEKRLLEPVINEKKNLSDEFFLKKTLGRAFYPQNYKAVFVFDSKKVFSDFEQIKIIREYPDKPLASSEFDNLISQAVWKLFDKNRREAAKRLGISDMDVLLCDAKIYDFSINGHQAVNSLNHRGRNVEISISQTFGGRDLIKKLVSFLPKRAKLDWVIEGGTTAAYLLSRIFGKNQLIFAKTMSSETFIYAEKNGSVSLFDYFKWGEKDLYSAIDKNLKIDENTGKLIVEKFLSGEISSFFSRHFKEILSEELAVLVMGLENAVSRAKIQEIYLDFPPFSSPLNLKFSEIFPKMIMSIDFGRLSEFLKINLINNKKIFKRKTDLNFDFLTLAVLSAYCLFMRGGVENSSVLESANRLAKRRMRWLMAQ